LIGVFIAIALLATRPQTGEGKAAGAPPWIRLSGWLAATVIFTALAAGYIRFASLVAERLVTATIVLVTLTLLLALVDAIFGEGLKRDSPRRRSFAASLGLRVKTLDLFAALFAGLLRALFVLVAIFIVIGALTTSAVDLTSAFDYSLLTFQIGETKIRLADIAGAFAILVVGIFVTRILYRWLSHDVLPRTELESSLQNSIATISGYLGAIAAIALALGHVGVNLENIALVAGALSIGIGFGLQAIVSNFVSGLILLTERPIRVGDWIVVKGEEGYVRKISVRSTEIETFERASVILPNSDLITGVVKNWTHANRLGRLSVPVGVSYDSDPDLVCEILKATPSQEGGS
jgi:small-conductance mechanosensitive channel